MADNKNTFVKSKEQVAAEKAVNDAAVVKYKNDALAARAERFSRRAEGDSTSLNEIRAARAEIVNAKAPLLDPETRGTVKPIDNPIPVRHEGEEPGEPDKGESTDEVKIRSDLQDNTPQPEGHRVPPERQLYGEMGDGGVMPVESRPHQLHPLADGVEKLEEDAPELYSTKTGSVTETLPADPTGEDKNSISNLNVLNENDVVVQDGDVGIMELGDTTADPGPRDPEGADKGKKTLADGTILDAEGEKHAEQPAGHNPDKPVEQATEGESEEARLDRLREEYKTKFKKPAAGRWSAEHIQNLIDGKV